MKKNISDKVALAVLLFLVDFIITGFVTCYLWNNVMTRIFGFTAITYWQGWAISILIGYFKPKNREKETDTIKALANDIVYTLVVAAMMWILVTFAGI